MGLGMEATVAGSPAEAVALAIDRAGPDDRVIVCGSLYVVADARRLLVPGAA
jgi:folylpolyglutamate synthase/dihydropteroate synthase